MHTIYKWFLGLYHENLYNFLAGFDCDLIPNQTNQFNGVIGFVTLAVVLLITCLYYFIRHARFNGFFSWLTILGIVALFSWGYGFGIVESQSNEIPNYVIYGIDNCYMPDGSEAVEAEEIDEEGIEEDDEIEEFDDEEAVEDGGCNSLQPRSDAIPMITLQTYIGFGFANMFVGMLMFFIFSFVLKRFSQDCRHTPWTSIWPKH